MAKISNETIVRWASLSSDWLAKHGFKNEDVKVGKDAWTVAHNTGMCREAYEDRHIVDAHIQTALEKIFPNCVFKDKKVY